MNWKPHYTGIETAESKRFGVTLYMQRDKRTKKLQFLRLNARRRHVGIFIGEQNYGSGMLRGGFQLFTNKFSFGIASSKWHPGKLPFVSHSGSMVEPYVSTVLILGKVVFAFRTPEWLKKRFEEKRRREWEAMDATFDDMVEPMYEDE